MSFVRKYGRKCQEIHLLSNFIMIKAKFLYELLKNIRNIDKIDGRPLWRFGESLIIFLIE